MTRAQSEAARRNLELARAARRPGEFYIMELKGERWRVAEGPFSFRKVAARRAHEQAAATGRKLCAASRADALHHDPKGVVKEPCRYCGQEDCPDPQDCPERRNHIEEDRV